MSYGNSGLRRVAKDTSGFTDQQRHDIIMATLTEFDKGTQAFQLRWRENSGEYLTGAILLKTPMFWFMKYKWSRAEIESLFFKARVEIDIKFDRALQQTFGGDPGPRWKGGGGVRKKVNRPSPYEQPDRGWKEDDDEKKVREDDSMNYHINHPNFQYNPVIQPVDFQATGGVNNKDKDPNNKNYAHNPDWERLKKKNTTETGPESVNLKPIPDYSKWKEPSGDGVFQVYIECPDGNTLTLNVEKDDPLHYVKKQIETKTNGKYPEMKQKLFLNMAELLNNDATLESYGAKQGDTLQLSTGNIAVYVQKKDGQKIQVSVDPHASIAALKKEIEKNTYPSIPANEQQLFKTKDRDDVVDNEFIDNYKSLFKYGIHEGDTVYLGGPTVWRAPTGGDSYPIFVECPDGRTLTLNVTKKDDIGYTKLQIQTLTKDKYPVNEQTLYFKARELADNNATLGDHNIVKNDVLQLSTGTIPIYVETREGKILTLQVDPHEKVNNVKKMIEDMTGGVHGDYPVKEQQLFNKLNKQELTDPHKSIFNYGVTANSELFLGGTIPVRIRKPDGSIAKIDIDPSDKTRVIKEIIEAKESIPVRQQTLIFNKQELNDNKPSKAYNIKKNDIIDLKLTYPIFVQKPDGTRLKLDVSPEDNFLSIKQRIENKTIPCIPVAAQTLAFRGKKIPEKDDYVPIKKYNIVENSVLMLAVDNDDPEALLEKILSRDAPAMERLEAVNKIHDNLSAQNPKYNVLLQKRYIPLLVCGYSVQVLDEDHNRNPVSKTAIETIPNIFKIAMDKDNDLAVGSLDETLDSLFKIYDDPKCRKIHPYARKAINKIVDDIIEKNDPESINKLVAKLGEKVDIANITTPEVRKFAMEQLQKVMFPPDNKLVKKIFNDGAKLKQLPDVEEKDLAPKGTNNREWFDIAIDEKKGPTQDIGDKHRADVANAISEMITDPNRDNKQIGLNLADLFNQRNPNFKNRLDGHARPIYQKWKFGPLKDYNMKMPPKGPQKKYKVDPLKPVDYRIQQQSDIIIGAPSQMPDL